mmetsp:Transcript_32248/g.76975  ORF Transcript_32248/g.76975 Transcript_32248/m.76975 type:complete len:217 (-) Transcript_32248:1065-1715(-)
MKIRHSRSELDFAPQRQEGFRELLREFAEIDVGAVGHPRECTPLCLFAARHHKGCPFFHRLPVLRVLHTFEEGVAFQRIKTLLQPRDLVLATCKGHVRRGMDKSLRLRQQASLGQVGPVLAAELKVLIDSDSLVNVNVLASLWSVVWLAQGRVTGPSIVPGIRALLSNSIQPFDHHNAPAWLQLLQEQASGCTHNATSNQDDIHSLHLLLLLLEQT